MECMDMMVMGKQNDGTKENRPFLFIMFKAGLCAS